MRAFTTVALALALATFPAPARAGIADSPLPAGLGTHVWSVAGVVDNGLIKTVFGCTNTGTSPITVGVELFDRVGTLSNVAGATALTFGPGASRLFATSTPPNFTADSSLGTVFDIGSARIVADSSKLVCSAWLVGTSSMASLTIMKKAKQKGQ